MAENSGTTGGEKGISKALFRKFGRTKEKNVATRLLKEVKNYMTQVKAMSVASQAMYKTISESYEESWKNADKVIPDTEELIAVSDNRLEKLNDNLHEPLLKYADQFRYVKKKIEKRGRKMMDYDGKRHQVESLENAKKRDEVKISKAHEELLAAKTIYETIHNELCEELPALYQSRIPTLCDYFRSLFSSEAKFQTDCAKIKTRLAELIETETETKVERSPAVKKPSHKTPPRPPVVQRSIDREHHPAEIPRKSETSDQSNEYLTLVEFGGNETARNRIASDSSEDEDNKEKEERTTGVGGPSPSHSTDSAKKTASATSSIRGSNKELEVAAGNPKPFHSSNSSLESNPRNASRIDGMTGSPLASSEGSIDRKGSKASIEEELHRQGPDKESKETRQADEAPKATIAATENGKDSDEGRVKEKSLEKVEHRKSSSSSEEETEEKTKDGAKYLYKVVAIHNYTAEDVDELNFEKGEVIGILPFEESSEEQDEGWLYGVKSSTGEKGVFPINFTTKA